MIGNKEDTLVLEDIETSFSVRLINKKGNVVSYNHFEEDYFDIVNLRNLVGALPSIFEPYHRVIYIRDFEKVWDHKTDPYCFGEFMEQLFAAQYHSNLYESADFKYHDLEQFSEFIKEYTPLTFDSGPFKVSFDISDDDLPY